MQKIIFYSPLGTYLNLFLKKVSMTVDEFTGRPHKV